MKDRAFINPFTDFGFKRIFGQTIHRDLLIDFLNALLKEDRAIVTEFEGTTRSGRTVMDIGGAREEGQDMEL